MREFRIIDQGGLFIVQRLWTDGWVDQIPGFFSSIEAARAFKKRSEAKAALDDFTVVE